METFASVDDTFLASAIDGARSRVVYVAPGIGAASAAAIVRAMKRDSVTLTIILDSDEDAYRIGYGDPQALEVLCQAAAENAIPLRRQPGLRIGLAVTDEQLVIWSPTARAVEPERGAEQPNAIVLRGREAKTIEAAVGAEGGSVLPSDAEIGRTAMRPGEIESVVNALKENPPAPFDLSRRTRVFSTRFQFVEFEIRGAEWTQRRIRLSSLLLNADLPDELQDVLDTQVRPFQGAADRAFPVPHLVSGCPAFHADGKPMFVPATQSQIVKFWDEIRDDYLRQIKGFGWLIRRDRLDAFKGAVAAYERTLESWVAQFKRYAEAEEARIVASMAASIRNRVDRAVRPDQVQHLDLNAEIKRGLDKLRVIAPCVRIVLKNVSWESTRDQEFLSALERALDPDELEGWFEEYSAAPQRALQLPR